MTPSIGPLPFLELETQGSGSPKLVSVLDSVSHVFTPVDGKYTTHLLKSMSRSVLGRTSTVEKESGTEVRAPRVIRGPKCRHQRDE